MFEQNSVWESGGTRISKSLHFFVDLEIGQWRKRFSIGSSLSISSLDRVWLIGYCSSILEFSFLFCCSIFCQFMIPIFFLLLNFESTICKKKTPLCLFFCEFVGLLFQFSIESEKLWYWWFQWLMLVLQNQSNGYFWSGTYRFDFLSYLTRILLVPTFLFSCLCFLIMSWEV